MSVTRLSSYFSFKAKSYFWVSSSLLLKFLQFLLVILILFLVFPLFSFIGILLKVALLVLFSTSSFLLPWAIFLVLSLFFSLLLFFPLSLSFFYLFSPSVSTSTFTSFFFYSFTPPPNSFPTFFRSFTPFKFTFSPLLFQSNSLFLFLKASISLLKPLSTGITYSHVYFHYRDSKVL